MLVLEDLLYTEDHLWVKTLETGRVSLGITDYGQSLLGEFSSLDIPDVGEKLVEGDLMATAQDIDGELMEFASPVTGTVTLVNQKVISDPDIVSEDPYEDGWLVQMKLEQPRELDDLMAPEDYELYVEEQRILREDMSDEDVEDELEVIEK
jgi:glycine cleavage system H protein